MSIEAIQSTCLTKSDTLATQTQSCPSGTWWTNSKSTGRRKSRTGENTPTAYTSKPNTKSTYHSPNNSHLQIFLVQATKSWDFRENHQWWFFQMETEVTAYKWGRILGSLYRDQKMDKSRSTSTWSKNLLAEVHLPQSRFVKTLWRTKCTQSRSLICTN